MKKIAVPQEGIETLYGAHDANLKHIESLMDVEIRTQGDELIVEGTRGSEQRVERLFEHDEQYFKRLLDFLDRYVGKDATILDVEYVSNAVHDFVPSGNRLSAVRDVVRTETCNTCHDPLQAHGGSRRDVRLCVTCHSSEITDFATGETTPHVDPDTGNSIGFPELIHKIHRGAGLPSVVAGGSYRIIGYMGSVHDYSTVHFPQEIARCESCHDGAQGERWQTTASRQACGACHDNVTWSGDPSAGEIVHVPAQSTDTNCMLCHGDGSIEPTALRHLMPSFDPGAPQIVLDELYSRFKVNDQIDQALSDRLQLPGQLAAQLPGCKPGLIDRLRVNQVINGFGL